MHQDKSNFLLQMQRRILSLGIITFVAASCLYGILLFASSKNTMLYRQEQPTIAFNVTRTSMSRYKCHGDLNFTREGGDCETHHLAFLKVHKTGSSTVQNIFLRYADSRNLTLVLGHDNETLTESGYANVISYSNSLLDSNIVPPPEGRHFDMLCCHVIYNRTQFEKYLPRDTSYIGIVREPFSRVESAIKYFNMLKDEDLSTFAANPLKYDRGPHSMINNRMAFEFGFPFDLFPTVGDNYGNYQILQRRIEEYLLKLYKEFDLILVNEYLTESLVLMKRLLGWRLPDILYASLNVAKSEIRRFSASDRQKLKSFLYLDIELYDFAVQILKSKMESAGDDFKEELKHFLDVKKSVEAFCQHYSESGLLEIQQSHWSEQFTVTKRDCYLFGLFETKYIQRLRLKQYGNIDN